MSKIAETKRLILRRWREEDRPVFRAMNADPEVMAHFPGTLSAKQSDALLDVIMAEPNNRGLCAVEVKSTQQIAGACGIFAANVGDIVPAGAMEIAWRFIPSQWGQGYAREAAAKWIELGFEKLGLDEIYSWTSETNKRALSLMRNVGLERVPELDFVHPRVPDEYPQLKRHMVTKITRQSWLAANAH